MSIFASKTRDTIPVPNDPPHTITVRKLTGREIERAQSEHLRGIIAGHSARGWAASFQAQLAKGTASEADAKKALTDPLNGYDRFTLVKAGVIGWSYGKDVTLEELQDLDDETLEWVARAAMKLTKPWLFETPAEAEVAAKNG